MGNTSYSYFGCFVSLPISVVSPQYQNFQPEIHILGTFTLITIKYLWDLEISIVNSSHSKTPLTAWNLFALVDNCHHSSKHRDICFGSLLIFCSLEFRVTSGFSSLVDLISLLLSFAHCPFPFPPLPHPPKSDSRAVLSIGMFFDYGNVLYVYPIEKPLTICDYTCGRAINKLYFHFYNFN